MMRNTLSILVAVAAAGSIASAAPRETCVPSAFGVPTRPGGPDWTTPAASGGDNTLNDPRWNNASALAFVFGSAGEMLHTRQLWAQEAGGTFLYLSFVSDLELSTTERTTSRDIYLAFHRPLVDTHGTADAGDDEHGYILQLHLGDGTPVETAANPPYCGKYNTCGTTNDWWRVFRDVGVTSNLGPTLDHCTNGAYGEQYQEWNSAPTAAPADLAWLAATNIAMWKEPAVGPGVSGQDAFRWGVELKLRVSSSTTWQPATHYNAGDIVENPITAGSTQATSYRATVAGTSGGVGTAGPIGATPGADGTVTWQQIDAISQGIPANAPWWFEAQLANTTSPNFSVAKFPAAVIGAGGNSGVQTSICHKAGIQDQLVHLELGDANPTGTNPCLACSVGSFAKFQTYQAFTPLPAGCDQGLEIQSGDIGSVPGAKPDDSIAPLNEFKPGDNWLMARVHNTSSQAIDVPLSAKFRLADWGSTGLDNPGVFDAIPGTANGVCSAGAEPSCTGSFSIAPDARKSILFDWNIDATTVCAYTGGGSCAPCTCDGSDPACAAGTAGTTSTTDATHRCALQHYVHECMYVELTAPGAVGTGTSATFVHASAYTNMNFASMSETAQTALLDARQLPKEPGQRFQDVWFIVRPRNLPATLPAGSTTTDTERTIALAQASRIAQPYVQDMARQSEERRALVRQALVARTHPMTRAMLMGGGQYGGQTYNGDLGKGTPNDELAGKIVEAFAIMGAQDAQRVGNFLLLAKDQGAGSAPNAQYLRDAVMTLGAVDAAQVVPMLDVYPFYVPFDHSGANAIPMASFALLLSHEATVAGYTWAIDGATKVSENLYHVRIPIGFARQIQVRAQAIVPPEAVEGPGNPKWPCTGCACGKSCGLVGGVASGTPGVLAGLWAWGWRRRRATAKPSRR